jgi:DNA-binding transcriptional LysR family regulator
MNIDFAFRQLRYFVVVAEELNFTRAAERLQIAQPPLSRQIQSLEQSLGVVLLERTNRRVALTAAGEVFLVECRQVLRQIERGVQAAQRVAQGEVGQITIGFEGSVHNDRILSLVQQFRLQFPDVALVMQESPSAKQVAGLQQGQLDIGLIEPIAASHAIAMMTLFSEPLVVALPESHALASESPVQLRQLKGESWITGRSGDGCGLLLRILSACQDAGFSPNIQQETNDLQMTLGFVASGMGITVLPESSTPKQSGIVYCPIAPPIPEIQLAIAWQEPVRSPITRSFLQIVENHFEYKNSAE